MKLIKILTVFFLILPLNIFANESVFLNTRSDLISLNESTQITITIKNIKDVKEVKILGIENFNIISQDQSSSYSVINNNISEVVKFRKLLLPKNKGKFKLKAIITANGKQFSSNFIQIKVKGEILSSKNIFLKTNIAKKHIYLGEINILSYELYSSENIYNYQFDKNFKINHFKILEFSEKDLKKDYKIIKNKQYVRYEIKKLQLIPKKPGTTTIPSYQIAIQTADKVIYLKTKPITLNIKNLPTSKKPKNFKNIIGNLELETQITDTKVKIGKPITLNIKLFGSCDLSDFNKIIEGDIKGFQIYETLKSKDEGILNNEFYSEKKFEIIIIPGKTGKLTFPDIKIPYFNTTLGKYKNVIIKGFDINVKGDENTNYTQDGNVIIKVEKKIIKNPKNDHYYILKINKSDFIIIITIIITSLALFITCFFLFKYWYKTKQSVLLKKLFKTLSSLNKDEKIFEIIYKMLKLKFKVSIKSLPIHKIEEKINNDELAYKIKEFMLYFENKTYGSMNTDINIKDLSVEIYHKLVKI